MIHIKTTVVCALVCAPLLQAGNSPVHARRDFHQRLVPTPAMYISMNKNLNHNRPRMAHNPAGVAFAQGLIIGAGERNWIVAKNFDAEIIWALPNQHMLATSPKVDGKHVYLALQSGQVMKVRIADGKTVWQTQLHGQANKPLVIGAGTLLLNTAGKYLYALATKDGKTKWLQDISSNAEVNILGGAAPIISHGKVYSGDANGKIMVLDLHKGKLLKTYDFARAGEIRSIVGHLCLQSSQQRLLFTSANGVVGNIDLNSDALLWRQKLPAITTSHCTGNLFYIGVGGGELLALDVHNGQTKWHKVLGWEVTTITAHAGQLYLTGAKGSIMRLLPRVGETVWQYNLGTSISVPAQIYRNMIFFATSYHNVYGFLL